MAIKIQDQRNADGKAKGKAIQAAREIDAALDDLTVNWDGLTQAAKLAAVKRGVIICLRAVKWLLRHAA